MRELIHLNFPSVAGEIVTGIVAGSMSVTVVSGCIGLLKVIVMGLSAGAEVVALGSMEVILGSGAI